ncbi:MAG: TspO/MBR family protein [Opitutaceae bacterium]
MNASASPRRARGLRPAWPGLPLWLLACFAAPAVSAWARPDAWYAALTKPLWNPPNWVFGPVWTTLYCLMGVAAWLVWRRGGWRVQRRPLGWFSAQLVLNALWTPLFFGFHRLDFALLEIVVLWCAAVATMVAFARASAVAAWLLAPYLAWVSFATFLTFTLWKLNP